MRVLFLTIAISFLAISGCKKEIEYKSEGLITGPDARMCACCGGWFIEIDSNTYRFDRLPDVVDLDLQNEAFPIRVKLNYSVESCGCLGDEITIGNMVKN